MRTRLPMPTGLGLDRATGTIVVDPRAPADVRNMSLWDGRAALRPGAGPVVETIAGPSAICHQAYFRAAAKLVIVTYTASSRSVDVYTADLNGNNAQLLANWGTLGDGAVELPRFSHAEMWGKMVLAHFEPNVVKRLVTKHTTGSSLTTLTANLDGTGAKNVHFAWVAAHLGFIFAGGFGSDSDKDRAEVVRVSSPLDPTIFLATHYVLVGERGELCMGGYPCATGLLIPKAAESHVITGEDKRTFRPLPADRSYGTVTHRAALTVGGTVYAWTHVGPQRTSTGYWEPLHFPLDLQAALPAGFPTAYELANCHADYDPDEEVLRWFFPDYMAGVTTVIALTLRGGGLRFSYESYPIPISCTARVSPRAEAATVAPAFASAVSHSGVQVGAVFQTKATVTLNDYVGDETGEVWARQGASPYTLVFSKPIDTSASTMSFTFTLPASGSWDVAIRFTRAGAPRSDHPGTDPTSWPAACKATGTVTALATLTPGAPTYTPGATLAAGTWGASWSAPASGATVEVRVRAADYPWRVVFPPVYSHNGLLVHTSAPDATSVSGLAIDPGSLTLAGRDVQVKVTQRLTVNGIAGSSVESAYSATAFFGLSEAPGGPSFGAITSQVTEPPGTTIVTNWTESASVPSASGGLTEVHGQFANQVVATNAIAVALGTLTGTLPAPTITSCATRGAGSIWSVSAWVRHKLTIAGVEQYTQPLYIGQVTNQVCQL